MENNVNVNGAIALKGSLAVVEEAVVCSLLVSHTCLPEVAAVLTTEMFHSPALGFIYGTIMTQYERGEKPDMVTTEAEMRRRDSAYTEKIGGLAAVKGGLREIRHAGNVAEYAREIKRCYVLRRLEGLSESTRARAAMPESDPDELIALTESSLLEIRKCLTTSSTLRPAGEIAEETLKYHIDQMLCQGAAKHVLTGFKGFDEVVTGLHNGELYIVSGRPGDGKSAVALQMAMNAAMAGHHSSFFSMEMAPLHIMDRLFTGYAGVDPKHLRATGITDEEVERMRELTNGWKQLPFYLDYQPGNRVENIRAQVLLQKKKGLGGPVFVDYLNMMDVRPLPGELPEHAIARNIRALKALSIEADCPVVVVAQMNRASEQRADKSYMPILTDLRDSGTIEQVADCVFFVYRPDRYGLTKNPLTGEPLEGRAMLLVIKNRNGSTGNAYFRYNKSFTRLYN